MGTHERDRSGADAPVPPESPDETATSDANSREDSFLRNLARAAPRRPELEDADRTGSELGHFRVLGRLGSGGMGVVYAAEDLNLHRTVALKVLPSSLVADPERRRRFLREARAASAVSHANIASVYEVGDADGTVYIAMERIAGRTLRAVLDEGGKAALALPEALRVIVEIARGLEKAHDAGVIHRDIKPENVMIGDEGSVKILDFGLAKRGPLDGGDGATAHASELETAEGRILGTPSYMSPEQAKGRPVDLRSDLFSLGVVFYELVTGSRPFSGGTSMELLIAIDRDEPVVASERNPVLPPAVDRVLARCLAKAPADRYAGCREVIADLETVRNSTEPDVRRPRWRSRFVTAPAVGAGLIALVTVLGLAVGRRPVADPAARPAPPESRATTSASLAAVASATPPASAAVDAAQEIRRVRLVVLPEDAAVEVDGSRAQVRMGVVEIAGALGSVHRVRLIKDKNQVEGDVSVTEGGAMPPKLEIPAGRAAPKKPAGKAPRFGFDD